MRAWTRPSFCWRSQIAVARLTRASFFPLIVSAGNTGRALERDRTSHTTISAPRRAMTSSSKRPTRTLRPQISKPRSSSNDATSASPRRARSALLDVEQRVADAVASSEPVAARLENFFADETARAAAGGQRRFRRVRRSGTSSRPCARLRFRGRRSLRRRGHSSSWRLFGSPISPRTRQTRVAHCTELVSR